MHAWLDAVKATFPAAFRLELQGSATNKPGEIVGTVQMGEIDAVCEWSAVLVERLIAEGAAATTSAAFVATPPGPARTERQDMHTTLSLIEIADEARLIRTWYSEAASDYRKAAEALQSIRDMRSMGRTPQVGDAERERDAAEAYAAHAKRCGECSQRLGELALVVAKKLPSLWGELRLVGSGARWHETPDFDWDAAIAELRRIEAEALAAAEALTESEGQPSGESGAKGASLDARMLETLLKDPESRGWSVTRWTEYLKCSRGGVHGTDTWTQLEAARKLVASDHATAKRRRPKGGRHSEQK